MQTRTKGLRRRGTMATGVALITALIAGCQGAATGPDVTEPGVIAPTAPGDGGGSNGDSGSGPDLSDTVFTTFTVKPGSRTTHVFRGEHKIVFPAHSVCDPTRSSYGPTEWDSDCVAADTAITVTAKSWTDADGHPHIDFSPALRFVPTETVTLYMMDREAAADPDYQILYCADDAATCVDEALTDPSVATQSDLPNGMLYRRIKHFSGYHVTCGRRRPN